MYAKEYVHEKKEKEEKYGNLEREWEELDREKEQLERESLNNLYFINQIWKLMNIERPIYKNRQLKETRKLTQSGNSILITKIKEI